MTYESLTYALSEHVARVTLNRPEAANAMNPAFWQEMVDAMAQAARDSARVVVLDGNGRHFTAGMDLAAFADLAGTGAGTGAGDGVRRRDQLRRTIAELQESFNVLERCRAPVIAAIHGACIGGGMDLISACDIRFCTEDAFFCIHETNIGMAADVGTLQRLPHLMPDGLVRELSYTGRRMTAAEAERAGLVNRRFPDKDAMMRHVLELAGEIAQKSPVAVAGCKEMLNYARDHSVADGLNYVATWNAALLGGDDMRAALAAQRTGSPARFDDLLPPAGQVVNRRA